MKKRVLSLLLAVVLMAGATANAAFPSTKTYTPGQFSDVADGVWYSASVQKVYELGLMNGSSDTTFNPGGMFTVAEAITVAGRMHSLAHGGSDQLPAASGPWYQGAVDYCVKNGLITKDQFDSYTRAATRAEMAGVIRAALPDDQWKAINSVSALPDVSAGTDYAQAIFDLYNAGVFTGSDDYGQFQPYAQITRAEVAAIVARCADPAQRKALTLKPLSQREAPELIGGYNKNIKMYNGRLAYQDPATKKWGYLDGNGNAVIPAQYDSVDKEFWSGLARVRKDGKYGLINTAGAVLIPLEQDSISSNSVTKNRKLAFMSRGVFLTDYIYNEVEFLRNDVFRVGLSPDGPWGAINTAGKVIVPVNYKNHYGTSSVLTNGLYIFATNGQEQGFDIYDYNGTLLGHCAITSTWADNNPLLTVKEGNKYALAMPSGKITEAVYDSVELVKDSPFAMVKYGNQVGLVGRSGELAAPGTYEKYIFENDYFAAYRQASGEHSMWDEFAGNQDDRSYEIVIGDATGVLYRAAYNSTLSSYDFSLTINEKDGSFFIKADEGYYSNSGILFQKDGTSRSVQDFGDYFGWNEKIGGYLMNKEGKVFGPRYAYYTNHCYEERQGWEDDNTQAESSYGFWDETGELSKPIYDSADEAMAAYGVYKAEQDKEFYARPENQKYEIRNNSAGKPIVRYGNDTNGWTNVIEFYKNNMYYDEIQELGEGYYACRFNTTWYLIHA